MTFYGYHLCTFEISRNAYKRTKSLTQVKWLCSSQIVPDTQPKISRSYSWSLTQYLVRLGFVRVGFVRLWIVRLSKLGPSRRGDLYVQDCHTWYDSVRFKMINGEIYCDLIYQKVHIWNNFPVNEFQKDKYQLILVYFLPREENKTF